MQFQPLSQLKNQLKSGVQLYIIGEQEYSRKEQKPRRSIDNEDLFQVLYVYNPDECVRCQGMEPMQYVGEQVKVVRSDNQQGEFSLRPGQWLGHIRSAGGRRRGKKSRKARRSSKKTMRRRR